MPAAQLQQTVQHLRHMIDVEARSASDRELLVRYVASKDEAAFAILAERYSTVVWGVCRRLLAHNQDAEDACQATFLVLARKADSIRKRESLRCWLHGVAFRVASRLRKQKLRRKTAAVVDTPAPSEDITWREVQRILDAELMRLPEQLRLPLILSYLEGKTRDEAAEELGWTTSTFRGRLERGRERLRKRLESKGVGLTAGLLAAMLSQAGEAVALSPALLAALERLTTDGPNGDAIRQLAEGAMRTMNLTAMKMRLAFLALIGLLGTGIAFFQGGGAAGTLPSAIARDAENKSPPKKVPPSRELTDRELATTAAKVRDAAIEWLKKNQAKDGTWEAGQQTIAWSGGSTSLAVVALVDCGVKANDPMLARSLAFLRNLKPPQTYVVALQTIALCRLNDKQDTKIIEANVEWLIAAAFMPDEKDLRGWSYTKQHGERADGSNTQFALLALYEAGRAGFKPRNRRFWESVRTMYLGQQAADGGWGYTKFSQSTFSMTSSGLCGLLQADDDLGNEGAESRKAKEKATVWLARKCTPFDGMSVLYNLHLLARIGRFSGETKIGDHDWYREGVEWLLKHQNADGSISDKNPIDNMKAISTSFGILFLNSQKDR